MTSLISRASRIPELIRFLDAWPVAPFGDHTVRIEAYQDNGHLVGRAELPGVDPDKDIEVTVEDNEFAIVAQRLSDKHDEFSYGSLVRSGRLPTMRAARRSVRHCGAA